jgi:hypothetical protein
MNQWQALFRILTADSHRLIRKTRGEGSRLSCQPDGPKLQIPGKFPSISDQFLLSGDAAHENE